MKILLTLLVICVSHVYSAIYLVGLERLEQCSTRPNPLIDFPAFKLKKDGVKTSGIINGDLLLKHDVDDKTTVKLKIYKKIIFKWVPILPTPSLSVCKFIKADRYFWPILAKVIDFPKTCPFPKGKYTLKEHQTLVSKLPAVIPKGCVRVDLTLSGIHGSSCIRFYITLSDPNSNKVQVCKV